MRRGHINTDILANLESLGRHPWAENLWSKTIDIYSGSASQLVNHLEIKGEPWEVARDHIEAFIADLLVVGKSQRRVNAFRRASNRHQFSGGMC